jgi:translation initiation factor IF-3
MIKGDWCCGISFGMAGGSESSRPGNGAITVREASTTTSRVVVSYHDSIKKGLVIVERIQNRINEQIRISPVRVIDQDGNQLGVVPTKDAIETARKTGLDLVEVAPDSKPPVCRIMDFGKFKYDKNKRQHKSKQHQMKLKEIRLRPRTGQHDIDFKLKQAIGFLQHKDKVQVTVVFRGRELAHIEEGEKVLDQIVQVLSEYGKLEGTPSRQPRRIICTLTPK